jgi:hypothetical protein
MRREQLFGEAMRRAETVITEAGNDEQVALLSFGKRFEVLHRFTNDKNKLLTTLRTLKPGWESTDYEQALRGAESLLGEVKTSGPKRVVLISDFQAPGFNPASSTFKLSNEIQLTTFDVAGNASQPNLAITNVEARGVIYSQKYQEFVAVHINNFSDEPRSRVLVDFEINDQTVEKREIDLASREAKAIEFSNFNLAEGPNRCVIKIAASDFPADNQFYFTLRRLDPAKALIAEGATRGRSESLYLQSALSTDEGLPYTFTTKSAGSIDPASLGEYSLVILNDAGPLSSALSDSLTKFVEAGGQLIIATGARTEAAAFNGSLGRIAPAVLREPVTSKPGESVAMTDVNFDHPIFEVFRQGGRLAAAHVAGYFRSAPRPNAAMLARYEDGSPALTESGAGKGRVLLFTSTLDPSWNDLPLTPLYLPFVQQMVRYTSPREQGAWYGLDQPFVVAKDAHGNLPAIDSPAGVRLSESPTPQGELLVTGYEPGFYRLRYSEHPDFAAVNIDGSEGDFTKLNFSEFIAAVTGGAGSAEGSEANRSLSNAEIEGRQRVWWLLLLTALLLLLLESFLASRKKRAKVLENAG